VGDQGGEPGLVIGIGQVEAFDFAGDDEVVWVEVVAGREAQLAHLASGLAFGVLQVEVEDFVWCAGFEGEGVDADGDLHGPLA